MPFVAPAAYFFRWLPVVLRKTQKQCSFELLYTLAVIFKGALPFFSAEGGVAQDIFLSRSEMQFRVCLSVGLI